MKRQTSGIILNHAKTGKLKKNMKVVRTALFLILFVLLYTNTGCPFRWLTGICCPGCGMTRAVISLLRLDFRQAFYYYPLVFLVPLVFVLYLLRKHFSKKFKTVLCAALLAAMLLLYLYRMINGSEVVYFKPSSGAVYKLIKKILRHIGGYSYVTAKNFIT